MTEPVLYVDELAVHAILNGWVDYLLLAATAQLANTPLPRRRLLAGAAIGTGYYLLYRLAQVNLLPGATRWSSALSLLSFASLMLWVAFGGRRALAGRWLGVIGIFSLLACLAGGSAVAVAYRWGSLTTPHWSAGLLAVGVTLLTVQRVGRNLTRQTLASYAWLGELQIIWQGRQVELPAWLDSGNRATDPLTHDPVIVAEIDALAPLFAAAVLPTLRELGGGRLPTDADAAGVVSSLGLRPLPYASVGQPHGLLWCLRPDRVFWRQQQQRVEIGPCLVALAAPGLDRQQRYQALVPGVVAVGLAQSGAFAAARPGRWAHRRKPNLADPARDDRSRKGGSLVHGSAISS